MLDLIEAALQANSFVYQRIDGQTALSRRIEALDTFNTDPNCTVMLASIGSIGEGYVEWFQPPSTSHSWWIICWILKCWSHGGQLCPPHWTALEPYGGSASGGSSTQNRTRARCYHNPLHYEKLDWNGMSPNLTLRVQFSLSSFWSSRIFS